MNDLNMNDHKELDQLCSFETGTISNLSISVEKHSDRIPILTQGECKGKIYSKCINYFLINEAIVSNQRFFEADTTFVSLSGISRGRTAFVSVNSLTFPSIVGIKSKDTSVLLDKYIFYYIKYSYSKINKGLYSNEDLDIEFFRYFTIPIVSIQEQVIFIEKIAAEEDNILSIKKLNYETSKEKNKLIAIYLYPSTTEEDIDESIVN